MIQAVTSVLLTLAAGPGVQAPVTGELGTETPSPWAAQSAASARPLVQGGAYAKGKAAAAKVHLKGLEDLASWCQKNKAFLQRDETYKTILGLDPEHATARKFLKYSYDRKAKKWIRKRPYRAPKPGKPEIVEGYGTQLAALDDALVETTVDLIEKFAEELGPIKRSAELRDLMKAAPNNARIRGLLGYIAVDGGKGKVRWTTEVALETEKRRAGIAKNLAKFQDSVPEIGDTKLRKVEEELDIEWMAVRRTKRVRVLANTDEEEADAVVEMAHTAWSFLPSLVGGKLRPTRGFTLLLIDGRSDREVFIDTYPGFSDAQRERFYRLGSTWTPDSASCACWARNAEARIDQACKQTTVHYLNKAFGITTKRGWLVEGIGLYVNQMVLGTRYSRHVTVSEYVDQTEPRYDFDLQDPYADWMLIAGDYLDDVKPTRLAATLGRNTSEMTPEDVVLAYALVAYLCEGFGPETIETVLARVGKGEASSVVALEELLKLPLPEIQQGLNDWLDEVGGHDY